MYMIFELILNVKQVAKTCKSFAWTGSHLGSWFLLGRRVQKHNLQVN